SMAIGLLFFLVFFLIYLLARPVQTSERWYNRTWIKLIAVWLALAWLMLRANAGLFPNSLWSWIFLPVSRQPMSRAVDFLSGALLLWRFYELVRTVIEATSIHYNNLPRRLPIATSIAIIAVGTLVYFSSGKVLTAGTLEERAKHPNIIVIGLDSFRRDVALGGSESFIPNIAAFRQHSFIEANVISPLARTFPAWVTILTGKSLSEHRARFNLFDQSKINLDTSFAWDLKRAGYRTVYATDETRFSNIGKEFGFDSVIAPSPGVTDFLLGQIGDLPLLNLAGQMPYLELLLPSVVGNRAFAHSYRANSFVGRITRELGKSDNRPTFIALHLCLAHWPYYFSQSAPPNAAVSQLYPDAVQELDKQFSAVIKTLTQLGYIDDNSLIAVLADHGETLAEGDWTPSEINLHGSATAPSQRGGGHGANLMSTAERGVFVMFSGRASGQEIASGQSDRLASLEDLRETLLSLAGIRSTTHAAMSIADKYSEGDPIKRETRRYVLLETGFRPEHFDPTHPDPNQVLEIAAASYQVVGAGRVVLNDVTVQAAMQDKDFGVTDGDTTLLAIRNVGDAGYAVVVDKHGTGTWDVYAGNAPAEAALPLIDFACADNEIRTRIQNFCVGH
ncbi:MAG: LTA synthase family protein, partial [Nevskia sp.]|nr:LTA synthase family protein [Nevskia sp.]